jgi:hypothetical protein
MPKKKSADVIPLFPHRPSSGAMTPKDTILEIADAIKKAPDIPLKRVRRKPALTPQTIEGDDNTQISSGKAIRQSIKGSGNVQVAGGVQQVLVRTLGKPKIEISPPPGSIGANMALRARIEALIKQINEYRYQRLGKTYRFAALYGELAKAFGLKQSNWKDIWRWGEDRAEEIIVWLEGKRDNTLQGRIQKAAKGEGYLHTRGHLFRQEKDYLAQLDWPEEKARPLRQRLIGKTSRADMNDNEFRNWVSYLRREVEKMYGETEK